MTWDDGAHQSELFDAVEMVGGEMLRLKAQFDAAPSDRERLPVALRMLRLGPRLIALRNALELVN